MLEIRRLTKHYTRRPAVDKLSFEVAPGRILGLLGPNGSGKSTTVNMLCGLLEPSSGEILLDGQPVSRDWIAYKRILGYVPEAPHVYPYLSGREYLHLVGGLRGLPYRLIERKASGFFELFGLGPAGYSTMSSYSKGMRQKVLICAALLHDPHILIFDEPLSGLDVTSALVFRDLVKTLAEQGRIVVYSSHALEVVEKLCHEVLILRKGKAAAHDSVEALRKLMESPSLEDVFAQLVMQEDTATIATRLAEVVRLEAA